MNQVCEEMTLNYLQLRLNYSFSVLHFISSFFFHYSAYVQLSSDLMSCLNLHLDKKKLWREDGSLYCSTEHCQSRE